MKRICVFAGSSAGTDAIFRTASVELAAALARRNIELVYGGGCVGLMGVLADAMLERGGRVTGVIPRTLLEREVGHRNVTELKVVDSMHERKATMAAMSDGFIALPGGYGTLEELFEVVTWAQLGLHAHPCGVLNVAGYFDGMLEFLDHAKEQGFVNPTHRGMLLVDTEPGRLIDRFADYQAPVVDKWLTKAKDS